MGSSSIIYRHKYFPKLKLTHTSLAGVYSIECTKTKSIYVGQSANIETRLANHKNNLRSGKHTVSGMQQDYNRYGDKYFVFESIHKSDAQDLLQLETFYIGQLSKEGYNIYNTVKCTDNMGMIQCNKDYRYILQKISDMLDSGILNKDQLEQALDLM